MIKVLHGADLHLDSPFGDFSASIAAAYREQMRQLPKKMRQLCEAEACSLLLLAGDIFDGVPYPETMEQLRHELALCPAPVLVVPGNHDPLESGLWDGEWPSNVHIFKEPGEVVLEELGLCVHHGSIKELRGKDDGYLHIGLTHGDESFSEKDIAATGLHYLALGHIHKTAMPRKAGNTWYGWPGAAQGRGFDETGDKGVFCLELSKDRCAAKLVSFGGIRFEIYRVDAKEPWQPPQNSHSICARVHLVGAAGQMDASRFSKLYEKEFLRLEVIDNTEQPRDLWEDCGDGTLRGLALEHLQTCADKQQAELAAAYLLAALEGREEP